MTSGCYPGVSSDCISSLSSRPKHNFRRKEVGSAATLAPKEWQLFLEQHNFQWKEVGSAATLVPKEW